MAKLLLGLGIAQYLIAIFSFARISMTESQTTYNFDLSPEVVVYLLTPYKLVSLHFTTHQLDAKRALQEALLLEKVLKDENSNSLAVCLAVQNAVQSVEHLMANTLKSEMGKYKPLMRRLKRISGCAVVARNSKFFSADRAAIKEFDRFLEKVMSENKLHTSFFQNLRRLTKIPKISSEVMPRINLSQSAPQIFDLRLLQTFSDLERRMEEIFLEILDLSDDFKSDLMKNLGSYLRENEIRHFIQLALQSTNKTKDGALVRETKLIKLLLSETILANKFRGPKAEEGVVEFNNHAAR
jgi:hypothetical protein